MIRGVRSAVDRALARPITRALILGPSLGAVVFMALIWVTQAWGPGDAIVYLAAGERLNAGHELYALGPGDRWVWINPPYWTAPLLSPPLNAVLWRPLALLPPELAVALWWVGGIGVCLAVFALFMRRAPLATGAALWLLAIPFVFLMGAGNVDAYRLGATVLVWWLAIRGRDVTTGVLVGVMAAIKLTPVTLLVWLVVLGKWRAVAAAAGAAAALMLVSVVGAGVDAHFDYLAVVRQTYDTGTAEVTLAGIGRTLGLHPELARWLPTIGAGMLCLGAVLWRRRLGLSFGLAVVASVVGTPATGLHTFGVLLAALAPLALPVHERRSVAPATEQQASRPADALATPSAAGGLH